jgi:hypothetical protein
MEGEVLARGVILRCTDPMIYLDEKEVTRNYMTSRRPASRREIKTV